MTSYRQIEANRRNALKSTGPKTEAGKQTSRCNAVRHGLTAETVIGMLEDAESYRQFEAAVIADYDRGAAATEDWMRAAALGSIPVLFHAQSAVERELVLRWKPDCLRFKQNICEVIGKHANCSRIKT